MHDEGRPRTAWSIEVSIFKDYKIEFGELLSDSFEFDWHQIKLPKLKGSSERDLKEKMKQYYPFIIQIYRRLSATGIKGKLLGIGWNVYRDFVTDTLKVTDNKFKAEDTDLLFITVNAT